MAGTLQAPNLIKDNYDKLVFTTNAIAEDSHELYMTDTVTSQDHKIERLNIASRHIYSAATSLPFEHELLAFDIAHNELIETSTTTFTSSSGFFCPKNGRVVSVAAQIFNAIEDVESYVDFGISVWDDADIDEDFLHPNVTKGWERIGLAFPGQDMDNYNEVVFDPSTMTNLDTNEFEQGNSVLIWWIFNDVDRNQQGLTRVNTVLEFDA